MSAVEPKPPSSTDQRTARWPCDPASVSFWEKSMDRATSYVTTNGNLQIYLCVLFATAMAALVTAAGAKPDIAPIVYRYIIPVFSLVILMLAFNIYSWITEQLLYLEYFGSYEYFMRYRVSYEAFCSTVMAAWKGKSLVAREWKYAVRVLLFMLKVPISLHNLYCYYFLIYLAAPYLSVAYVVSGWRVVVGWGMVLTAQCLIAATSLRSSLIFESTWPEVAQRYRTVAIEGDLGSSIAGRATVDQAKTGESK